MIFPSAATALTDSVILILCEMFDLLIRNYDALGTYSIAEWIVRLTRLYTRPLKFTHSHTTLASLDP